MMKRGRSAPAPIDWPASGASTERSRRVRRIPRRILRRISSDAYAYERCAPARSLAKQNHPAAAAPGPSRSASREIRHFSRFVTFAYQRAQAAAGAEQPRLDRGGGSAGYAREVAVAPIVLAHQQYQFALIGGHQDQRTFHLRQPCVFEGACRGGDLAVMRLPRREQPAPSPSPQMVEAGIASDFE